MTDISETKPKSFFLLILPKKIKNDIPNLISLALIITEITYETSQIEHPVLIMNSKYTEYNVVWKFSISNNVFVVKKANIFSDACIFGERHKGVNAWLKRLSTMMLDS